MSAPSTVEADVPPPLSDGRGVAPASPDCQQCRQPDAGRSKQVAEIAENAGIDGNEILEGSPGVDPKSETWKLRTVSRKERN